MEEGLLARALASIMGNSAPAAAPPAGAGMGGMGAPVGPMQAAPPASPGMWDSITGGMDNIMNDPLKMAMLTGGLGLLSGQSGAEALQGAGSAYQGLKQGEAAAVQSDLENQFAERQMAIQEGQLELGQERLAADKSHRSATMKSKDLKSAPTGVDEKVWNRALQTAQASVGFNEDTLEANPVETSAVYRLYNSMAPDNLKIYMPFGVDARTTLNKALADTPEASSTIFQTASELYGGSHVTPYQTRWEAHTKREAEKVEKASADKTLLKEASAATVPEPVAPMSHAIPSFLSGTPTASPWSMFK